VEGPGGKPPGPFLLKAKVEPISPPRRQEGLKLNNEIWLIEKDFVFSLFWPHLTSPPHWFWVWGHPWVLAVK
jgi:hypothetical protein